MPLTQFKWAQRPEEVYVIAEVVDATDVVVTIEAKKIIFSATVDGAKVDGSIDLKGEVVPEESSWCNTKREVQIKLAKKIDSDDDKEYWSNLVAKKQNNVKVDWARWKDEDELNGDENVGDFGGQPGGMPPGMGGMGGGMPGGMGGMPGGMGGGMPGGMGGMPGMEGMGGMDMEALMAQMGGAGGMGGMPGMEGMMGGAGGMPPGMGDQPDSDDEPEGEAPKAE